MPSKKAEDVDKPEGEMISSYQDLSAMCFYPTLLTWRCEFDY